MKDLTTGNFGILIAFVLPGAVALLGVSYFSPAVEAWLDGAASASPTIGGFLYLTLAAVAAGLTASTVRWMVIDTIHHCTGIPRPQWDFSRFDQKVAGYDKLGEIREGSGASEAFLEIMDPDTTDERREQLRSDLVQYCAYDTLAMVRVVEALEGAGS